MNDLTDALTHKMLAWKSKHRPKNVAVTTVNNFHTYRPYAGFFLQCSDTVGWARVKGIRPVKNWVLVCWWWRFDWSFARLIAPVATITSIVLSYNKIRYRLTQVHLENGRWNGEKGLIPDGHLALKGKCTHTHTHTHTVTQLHTESYLMWAPTIV